MHYEDSQAEIHKVVVGPMDNNVYVLRCKQTGDAVLLDAANEHDKLLDLCRRLGVRQVLETHGHWDHIQAVPAVRDAGYEVGRHRGRRRDAAVLRLRPRGRVGHQVGRLRLHTIPTPGHTPGSMCFRLEGSPVLFSGDTLFPGGPGATSFPGATSRPSSAPSRTACSPAAGRHPGPARPRRRHHHRDRATPPAGVDRPGLVAAGRPRLAPRPGRQGARWYEFWRHYHI